MSNADQSRTKAEHGLSLFTAATLLFSLLFVLLVLAFGADWLLRTDNFPVRHVRFEGEFKQVTQKELESAVMNVVHGNFLLLDLNKVKAQVESLPWVYKASVRRQWPQDVHVHFTEQKMAARWGERDYLNQVGDVFQAKAADLPADLPRLEGPDGTGPYVLQHYNNLGRILVAADLKLERITLTARRTWRLTLQEGMVLVLDREQPAHKLERFARVYAKSLLPLDTNIRQVDLRYTNGFSVEQLGGDAADVGHAAEHAGGSGIRRTGVANKG